MSSWWWILPLAFFMAGISDYLSCLWQAALRNKHLDRLSAYAGVLESLSWIPLAIAIDMGDGWAIAIASILGAAYGSRLGGRKYSKAVVGNTNAPSSSPPLNNGLGSDGENTVVRHG